MTISSSLARFPIPEGQRLLPEVCFNLMSFSTPFEVYPPICLRQAKFHARSFSLKSRMTLDSRSERFANPERTEGDIV